MSDPSEEVKALTDWELMRARGWTGPAAQDQMSCPDSWLIATGNAYEVQSRTALDAAKAITPDTSHRRKRIAHWRAVARQHAMHAYAMRELYSRRRAARASIKPKGEQDG